MISALGEVEKVIRFTVHVALLIKTNMRKRNPHCHSKYLFSHCAFRFFSVLFLQVVSVLEGVLSKLSRYDEGTFFSSLVSFTVSVWILKVSVLLSVHNSENVCNF